MFFFGVRVQGEGAEVRGRKGDLLIEVQVNNDAYFTRKGRNIHTDVDIPLHIALLGFILIDDKLKSQFLETCHYFSDIF